MALMLQSLLEERFHLKLHHEMRDFPVYLLTVGKGGAKLKLSDDQTDPRVAQPQNIPIEQRRGIIRRTDDGWIANAVRMSTLANLVSQPLGRPVLDKTGLEGMYDFKLNWVYPRRGAPAATDATTPSASDPADGSIFTAIEELGLKLESTKEPFEVLVIDSVQKPSEN